MENHDFSKLNPFKGFFDKRGMDLKKVKGGTWLYSVTFLIWVIIVFIDVAMIAKGSDVGAVKLILDSVCVFCWGWVAALHLNKDLG